MGWWINQCPHDLLQQCPDIRVTYFILFVRHACHLLSYDSLYDWNPDGPSQMSSLPYPFFPMLWGGDQAMVDAFNAVASSGTYDIYMGFNE